ncbi:MAG: hypothetical protein ACE5EF_00930 [Dehalococcoidia bacterium]
MQISFTDDELMEAVTVIINRMADEAGLPPKDRAAIKRWKSSRLKLGSEDFQDLVRKANEDFERTRQRRERSQIRKPDWRT